MHFWPPLLHLSSPPKFVHYCHLLLSCFWYPVECNLYYSIESIVNIHLDKRKNRMCWVQVDPPLFSTCPRPMWTSHCEVFWNCIAFTSATPLPQNGPDWQGNSCHDRLNHPSTCVHEALEIFQNNFIPTDSSEVSDGRNISLPFRFHLYLNSQTQLFSFLVLCPSSLTWLASEITSQLTLKLIVSPFLSSNCELQLLLKLSHLKMRTKLKTCRDTTGPPKIRITRWTICPFVVDRVYFAFNFLLNWPCERQSDAKKKKKTFLLETEVDLSQQSAAFKKAQKGNSSRKHKLLLQRINK